MLTESGDVIMYIFLLLADVGPFILDIEGGGSPVFSAWEFVRFEIARGAMSLDQSPLAVSCRVSASGGSVWYSGEKRHNSGIAIS